MSKINENNNINGNDFFCSFCSFANATFLSLSSLLLAMSRSH